MKLPALPVMFAAALSLLCCATRTQAQALRPDPVLGYAEVHHHSQVWGGIYRRVVGPARQLVLQIFDLRYCAVDPLLFGIRDIGRFDGRYAPERVNPSFYKCLSDSALGIYKEQYGTNVLSISNGVFFEAPSESSCTKLAYPVLYGGVVVSSGGSPYGPPVAHYPLKVLQFADGDARIHGYDPRAGFGQTASQCPNQIVTLQYKNHPNIHLFPQLREGYKNRYHLITVVRPHGSVDTPTVIMLSSDYDCSIIELATELKRISPLVNDDDILTLDGGSSVSIKDPLGIDLIRPRDNVRVPMYLGMRLKGERSGTTIRIFNPRTDTIVDLRQPFFIFYAPNDHPVALQLLQNETLISDLRHGNDSSQAGLFVWNPSSCEPGEGYMIRLKSPAGGGATSEPFTIRK